jgi:hypothetical protein
MPNPKIGPPNTPEFLSQVPKSVLRVLDVSEVFRDALSSMKLPENEGPVIALRIIESYFDAAKRQQRRIERAKASSHSPPPRSKVSSRGRNLFHDVHFYIISWQRIYKIAEFIRDKTKFSRTGLVIRRYNRDLENRRKARVHLEHFEEQVPGGKKHNELAVPNDLLNMENQYLTFGGLRVDIGPDSIRLLKMFRDEFFTAVKYDSIEALARKDESRLSFLLNRAAKEVSIARSTRKVKRMLKGRT